MLKKISVILVICTLLGAIGSMLVACGGDPADTYGKLSIADMTMKKGETATIEPKFTGTPCEVNYTYEGNIISIAENKIIANEAGVVLVTASTPYHKVTFTVTVTEDKTESYGTLTVADITVEKGKTAIIAPVFSESVYGVTYTFEGTAISINGGVITANEVGTVTVTAKTAYHTTTFTVTVTEEDMSKYGTLTIANITVEKGKTATITPVFSAATYGVTYTFEGTAISINGGVITANEVGTVTVTATTEHHAATFTVTVTEEDMSKYGTLTIASITVEKGMTATIAPVFSAATYGITYTFEGSKIAINGGVITANEVGTVTVTAKTAYHTTTFTVTVAPEDMSKYGTLSIANITVEKGKTATIVPVFSAAIYGITYTFEGTAISINGGVITANEEGTVMVTAKTAYHTVKFSVTVTAPAVDYGTLTVRDIYAWINYPASDFYLNFSKPQYAENVNYNYDSTALTVDSTKRTVTAHKAGKYPITVTSENFKATFYVTAQSVDKNAVGFQSTLKYDYSKYTDNGKIDRNKNLWKANGIDGKSTIFIGDSFFDENYWTNFYTTSYVGKDAIRMGISSSTSYDWEQFADSWMKDTDPKNIVMHMGTNNIYDDGDDAATAISALQRMFTVMHKNLPNAKIYWFSISQRDTTTKKDIVTEVNAAMKTWCDERSYITYIHTVDTLTTDMLKDTVHPKPESYTVFVNALAKTDIVIEDLPPVEADISMEKYGHTTSTTTFNKSTGTLSATSAASNQRAASYLTNKSVAYSGNFAVKGRVTGMTNGWTAFFINSAATDVWFSASNALPAAAIVQSTGTAKMYGYFSGSGGNTSITTFNNVTGSNFEYTVISYNGKLLWKIGNSYKEIILSDTSLATYFGIVNERNSITATVEVTFDNTEILAMYNAAKDTALTLVNKTNTTSDTVKGTAGLLTINGDMSGDFIISGKLDITEVSSNSHIQFGSDTSQKRFLLWRKSDAYMHIWLGTNAGYGNSSDATDPDKLQALATAVEWKIVKNNDDCYLYINGELKMVASGWSGNKFYIGSEDTACKFYDMTLLTGAAYTAEIVNYSTVIAQYGSASSGGVRV